jgi:peptidoglycan/LPS O-acetylase OafA/YrhL
VGQGTRRARAVVLAAVWLAVVAASVWIVVTRRAEYGWWVYVVPAMAAFILVCFAAAMLPKQWRRVPGAEVLGHLSVGGLILAAVGVLGYAFVSQVRAGGIVGAGVILLFLVCFVRIFRDYVRDWRRGKLGKGKT